MDKKALVGLSGGVDSSVAAALLRRQGYDLVGVTLWLMKGKGQCCSEGMVDAAFICEQLGIPHQIVDSREVFQAEILDYVVSSYAEGITPLPCSQCNRAVKFGPMLRYGRDTLGIERLATGHYAQVGQDQATRRWQLRRALDRHKDQSYFLYDLSQEVLSQVLFPLGELTKTQTRQIAQELGLKTADKPESQDLCLVEAHGDLRTFLEQYLAPKPGEIVDLEGRVLGRHEGIHHYTIGQRKGLGVAAPEPLYVVKLDPVRNQVIVGNRDSAGGEDCWVSRLNWVSIPEPRQPLTCEVQVRYRSTPVAVLAIPAEDGRLQLRFAEPQFGIAPGQAAVLYQGDILLGGGIIERPQN